MCEIDVRFLWHRETEIIDRAPTCRDIVVCLDHVASGKLKPVIDIRIPAGAGR